MKILNKYFEKLKYVYTKRFGCSILISILTITIIAIIISFLFADSPNAETTESSAFKGILFSYSVFLLCFLVAPIFLKKKMPGMNGTQLRQVIVVFEPV
jgi:hypothetical protein